MVLGETVHSFWIAVQTQENMVRNDEAARELQEKDMWSVGSQEHWRKNFQANANANQNLCIGLNVINVVGQASTPGPNGGGLREGLQ
jgi:hypothetical protein